MATDDLTIAAVGDYMISRRPSHDEIINTRPLFEGTDVVVANIDTVLSEEGTPTPKWANLRGPRAAAGDLRKMGIDVAVLANNHAMDYRAPGMLDTSRALTDAGIQPVGAGRDIGEATRPTIIEHNGVRVAILAMSCTLPIEFAAAPDWPGIAPVHVHYAFAMDHSLFAEQPGSVPEVRSWLDVSDRDRVQADVASAAAEADAVLAVVHWGVPSPWRAPSHPVIQEYQRELGHALVDAGTHAVIGNHAHELHGVEFYKGAPIAYCLGNFWIDTLSDYDWMGRESVVLNLTLTREGLSTVTVTPIMLDPNGLPERDNSGTALELLRSRSAPFDTTVVDANGRISTR